MARVTDAEIAAWESYVSDFPWGMSAAAGDIIDELKAERARLDQAVSRIRELESRKA
ncbi:Uncharacterised protein [Nocardia otitidiscaviarum]|uniref:Uncharacterized protein n=1 Tax=Nocardia otitidiscaviarum TaxID=1823 RepID=A0A378Y638_9NOCA|nr:hypothetical protein [Nocardia otitidiscaviarum]SUA72615.1 Uncharacterised protein [Nocardia otitidiscaviarum]SUA72675.1 Uncharacterised protein [Nocardia otitidiscaviarum]